MLLILGHRGLVGSALCRRLDLDGRRYTTCDDDIDLSIFREVEMFFHHHKPTHVILAAAKVGGIRANDEDPVGFLVKNVDIQNNVLLACQRHNVTRVLFLGSSCVYPRECSQPIREEFLMTGLLEPTNSAYAIAKIAGIELCRALRRQYGTEITCVMPCNLYGPNDTFDPEKGHVIPSLIRKFLDARENPDNDAPVVVWGTGTALREFLHVDDLADALLLLLDYPETFDLINVGSCGAEVSIRDLVRDIADATHFEGDIAWDTSQPDGTPRKVLDCTKIRDIGWLPEISLSTGLATTIDWYIKNRM